LLKIELSLPKLLFGNNFDELQYKDFLPITEKLVDILKQMGVITTAETLAQAPVAAIHYSKNISLTDDSTPYHYINKIKEANVKLSALNQTSHSTNFLSLLSQKKFFCTILMNSKVNARSCSIIKRKMIKRYCQF